MMRYVVLSALSHSISYVALYGALDYNTGIEVQHYHQQVGCYTGICINSPCIFTDGTSEFQGELNARSAPCKYFGKKIKK
jgi:hypothetical protein